MSLVSQEQLMQNQQQLRQLDEQRQKQVEQTKSFQSNASSAREMVQRLRTIDHKKERNDPSNPLFIQMPTRANPTEVMAARFNSWRNIIGCLIHYLKETVSVHEEISRQQIRLHHAISFPFITQGLDGELYQPMRVASANGSSSVANAATSIFSGLHGNSATSPEVADLSKQKDEFDLTKRFFLPLGSGSIQDLPTILYQYHANASLLAQSVVKELNGTIIPRLQDLRRDLLVKIKEIRSLQSDFRNNVDRYHQETRNVLKGFVQSIDVSKRAPGTLPPRNDPYLLKYSLDGQIKRQLTEENYLHEAFINIQTSGKELEKVVYIEIQTALTVYAKLMGQQAQNIFDRLISKLDTGILAKNPGFEWDSFIAKDTANFIDLNTPMRHLSDMRYKYQIDPITLPIRSGYLERKSKYLKSYARGWYVLTSCFIHEFKSPDRKKDPIPVMSLSLDDCQIAEHSRKDVRNPNTYHKFVLHARQKGGLLRKGHNWVFRAESYDAMMEWYNDLKRLTQLPTPQSRSTIAWERRKNRDISSMGASISSSANSLSSTGIQKNGNPVSVAGNRTSFHKMRSTASNYSAQNSMTNRSIDTMLGVSDASKGRMPENMGSSQGVPKSMVTNDVVLNLQNDTLAQHRNSQNSNPVMSKRVGGNNAKTVDESVSTAGLEDIQADNAKDSYIDGTVGEKFGEMNVSDDTRKETQI
ncbi:hypothetical protein HII12_002128 [Brettanomyces bruxellensis]|uniref:PH domain-containing protein n=1 Tax=Dekkera bruxellensis TaxID=5007 RepID=A0A8H6EWE3_DEKBR|nr:hypothetical protein HII12_002128 [Brettanomyces bruxellensis]